MKKKQMDVNNLTAKKRQKDHLYSDILGAEARQRSPVKKASTEFGTTGGDWKTTDVKSQVKKDYTNYGSKTQKHQQLKSSLDTHDYPPSATLHQEAAMSPEKSSPNVALKGRKTKAVKVKEMSSNFMGDEPTFSDPKPSLVVDFDLTNLPENANPEFIKKTAGVKHVVSATIEEDSIKNVCTGKGRVKLRIPED